MQAAVLLGLFAWGVGLAFISSLPPGPINLAYISLIKEEKWARGRWMAAGIVLCDALVAAAAILTRSALARLSELERFLQPAGCILLLVIGVYTLLKRKHPGSDPSGVKTGFPVKTNRSAFLTGVGLYMVNPGFLAFWLAAAHSLPLRSEPVPDTLAFGSGALIGTGLWFTSVAWLVRRWDLFSDSRSSQALSFLTGWSFVLLGVGLLAARFVPGIRGFSL